MSGKIIRKVIGFSVVCALLAGCLAGCGAAGNTHTSERPDVSGNGGPIPDEDSDASERPSGSETGRPIPDDSTVKPPAAKTLRRETVTTSLGDDTSVAVFEYLKNGLAARFDSTYGGGAETYDIRYEYDAHGDPCRIRMNYDDDTDAVIEITNRYENGKIVSAQISDILLNGESALDADLAPDSFAFHSFLSTFLRFLQHYEGYRDAAISIRNSETGVRLQNGEAVYLCSDMGTTKTVTELTRNSNGHKIQLVTTAVSGSDNSIPASMTEVDEFGRIVKIGAVMGRQSMIMRIDYETQPSSDTHQRTETGHVADVQNDLDLGYSNDELEALALQSSFIYTFAGDVLVFSEVIMGTQKTTCEYSADGLLLRQTTETDLGDHTYSVATEYEYK